jgi:hypothetical protein
MAIGRLSKEIGSKMDLGSPYYVSVCGSLPYVFFSFSWQLLIQYGLVGLPVGLCLSTSQ